MLKHGRGLATDRMTDRQLWSKLMAELAILEGQIEGTLDPTARLARVRRVRQLAEELRMRGTQLRLLS